MYSDRTPELISPLHHDEYLPPIPQSAYYEVNIEPDVFYLNDNPENQVRSGMGVTAYCQRRNHTQIYFAQSKVMG